VASRAMSAPRALPEGALKLGVRPEYVAIAEAGAAGALPATVTQLQDIGTSLLLTAAVEGGSLKARLAPEAAVPAVGQPVWLRVLGEHTCFYANEELV
jgi:glycerol transport system ATP-binding protein